MFSIGGVASAWFLLGLLTFRSFSDGEGDSSRDWMFNVTTQENSDGRALRLMIEQRISWAVRLAAASFRTNRHRPSAVFRAWFRWLLERRVRKQKILNGESVKCEAF
ncbi:MAG: hypothetical protein WB439_05330 [Acidobacteriaceae bacterium]